LGDLVQTELDEERLGSLGLLVVLLVLGSLGQSGLLVLRLLRSVLAEESEEVLGCMSSRVPWLESQALVNWLSAGGTFSLFMRILFCLWTRMYLGHLTNLVKSLFGWTALPTVNFLGVLSNRPLFWTFFLAPPLEVPVFLVVGATFLGCDKSKPTIWILY